MTGLSGRVGRGASANRPTDVALVQALLQSHARWLSASGVPTITGVYDMVTERAIMAFQREPGALLKSDGIVSPGGFTERWLERLVIARPRNQVFDPLCRVPPSSGLTASAFADAAKTLNCEAAAIKAVAQTETKRAAWDEAGRPAILFERHYFSRLTDRRFDHSHPDISNKVPGGYGAYSAQYPKLLRAAFLNEDAALQSASWGSFQIMGANYAAAGYATVRDFVDAMATSEQNHLNAFVAFIKSDTVMSKALRDKNWGVFASHYNGPDYKKNDYDTNMAKAYAALKPAAPAGARP